MQQKLHQFTSELIEQQRNNQEDILTNEELVFS